MGCHPSHWRTHIFQRGRSTTNQHMCSWTLPQMIFLWTLNTDDKKGKMGRYMETDFEQFAMEHHHCLWLVRNPYMIIFHSKLLSFRRVTKKSWKWPMMGQGYRASGFCHQVLGKFQYEEGNPPSLLGRWSWAVWPRQDFLPLDLKSHHIEAGEADCPGIFGKKAPISKHLTQMHNPWRLRWWPTIFSNLESSLSIYYWCEGFNCCICHGFEQMSFSRIWMHRYLDVPTLVDLNHLSNNKCGWNEQQQWYSYHEIKWGYPLVNKQFAIENDHLLRWFTH